MVLPSLGPPRPGLGPSQGGCLMPGSGVALVLPGCPAPGWSSHSPGSRGLPASLCPAVFLPTLGVCPSSYCSIPSKEERDVDSFWLYVWRSEAPWKQVTFPSPGLFAFSHPSCNTTEFKYVLWDQEIVRIPQAGPGWVWQGPHGIPCSRTCPQGCSLKWALATAAASSASALAERLSLQPSWNCSKVCRLSTAAQICLRKHLLEYSMEVDG